MPIILLVLLIFSMCLIFIFVSQLSQLDSYVLFSIFQTTSTIVNTSHQADNKVAFYVIVIIL